MQTWKVKRSSYKKTSSTAWKRRSLLIGVVLIALLGSLYVQPALWNRTANWVGTTTGQDLSRFNRDESVLRLGLDLQGGTHLVYEADMSQIPESDRVTALEGVRDVIERRVNSFGVSEPVVQTTSTGDHHRIIAELAGITDVEEAIRLIGETPVLEFKEPGQEVLRDPTPEEQTELETRQAADREAAQAVLVRAQSGEDFDALVQEVSIDSRKEEGKGIIEGLTAEAPVLTDAVASITTLKLNPGAILPELAETPDGINVLKYVGTSEANEQQLSHILICFEGKTSCANPIPALDASIQIQDIKAQVTPENFAELAKQYSTDPGSAPNGGELGWIQPGQNVPAFELAATALENGQISDVVETEYGYHLIYKQGSRTTNAFSVQRIVLPYTTLYDILPDVSPWKNTELSGRQLERSSVQFDQQTGTPYVAITFNKEGGDLFGELTSRLQGQYIGIFLDGQAISTPTVNQPIYGGNAIIEGGFTIDEAKLLAQRLNAGALPVPVELISQQTVGPTLGAASLDKSVTAGLIGFALVAFFMLVVYRLPGLVATIALAFYAMLNLTIYKFFGVTMTLSGVAGFVLSMGIAVDANVLIIERFKEEFRAGRDLQGALDEGFKRAWAAIRDGNITTLIAAAVLYWFSTSFIRGFALTLSIGVLVSMFTAIFVTRILLKNVLDLKALQQPVLFAVRKNNSDDQQS